MGLPPKPVTLTAEQVAELNTRLADMRHNINNNLSLIVASAEMIRRRPETAPRMIETLAQQPERITVELKKYTAAFEQALGINRE